MQHLNQPTPNKRSLCSHNEKRRANIHLTRTLKALVHAFGQGDEYL